MYACGKCDASIVLALISRFPGFPSRDVAITIAEYISRVKTHRLRGFSQTREIRSHARDKRARTFVHALISAFGNSRSRDGIYFANRKGNGLFVHDENGSCRLRRVARREIYEGTRDP